MFASDDDVGMPPGESSGSVVSPNRIPLHTLIDVDGLTLHYRHISELAGVTVSAFLYDPSGPRPLAEGRDMIWHAGSLCQEISAGSDDCLQLHWKNALSAMESGKPTTGSCVCGEGVLLSCPIILETGGRRCPKACLTFSLVSKNSMRSAKSLASYGKSAQHVEVLRKQTLQKSGAFTASPVTSDFLVEMVARTSREISLSYANTYFARRMRLMEESMGEQQTRLQMLIDDMAAQAMVVDKSMCIQWYATSRERRGDNGNAVGMKCHEYLWSEEEPCENCPASVTLQTGLPQTAIRETRSPGGQRLILQLKTTPILDDSGAIRGALVVSQEATSQVQAREDVERYHRLVDNVSDMVLMSDYEGHILAVNKRVPEVLGYTESELLHMMTPQLMKDFTEAKRIAREAESFGSAVGEIRLLTRKGEEISVELSLTYSPKGQTFQGVMRDIAERKRLTDELQRRTQRLEDQHRKLMMATEQKAKFFTNMSHELRTPMTSIVGFTELILDDLEDPVSPGQRELMMKVSQNAHRLLGMINDLLDLARVEAGRVSATVTAVDIEKLLDQIVSNMKPLARDKDLKIVSHVLPGEPVVYTDEQRLSQILVNLVSNAIKFTPAGKVEINAHSNSWKLEVSVRDTGIGIRSEDIPKIFEEFHTGLESSKSKIPGTGLGLAITKKLTQLLGGKIMVHSVVGKGSTFTVTLPNRRPKSAELDPDAT